MSPRDVGLMLLVDALWAFNFIAAKVVMLELPPLFFTGLRFGLLLILLLPFLRPLPARLWPAVAAVALCMGILHFALMFTGLGLADDVSSVAIASQLHVPFATVLAVVCLGERIRWRRTLGIAVAFAGVALIGFDPVVLDNLLALGLVVAAALAMAVNTIVASRLREVSAFTLQAWMACAATPGLLLLSLIIEDGHWQAASGAGWQTWAGIAYSCIGASLIGHGIVYTLLTRYPVNVTAPYLLLSPVLAVVFGVLVWGDSLSWRLVVGGLMTLGGVAVITVRTPAVTAAATRAGP